MTHAEMNREADTIRDRWTSAVEPTEPTPIRPRTQEEIIEAFRQRVGRPLTKDDIPMIAALTSDHWAPAVLRDRRYRQARKRLLRYAQCPDLTGLMQPDDEDIQAAPEIWDAILKQQGVTDDE